MGKQRQWDMGTVAWVLSQGLGDSLGVILLLGYPCHLSQINTVNIFQEETRSTLHQGPSGGLKDSSR